VPTLTPTLSGSRCTPADGDLRCHCGNLLARLVAGGVELKCRRCKRTVLVPLASEARRNR
jgi:hypothetical protein